MFHITKKHQELSRQQTDLFKLQAIQKHQKQAVEALLRHKKLSNSINQKANNTWALQSLHTSFRKNLRRNTKQPQIPKQKHEGWNFEIFEVFLVIVMCWGGVGSLVFGMIYSIYSQL